LTCEVRGHQTYLLTNIELSVEYADNSIDTVIKRETNTNWWASEFQMNFAEEAIICLLTAHANYIDRNVACE
jgi:hypothetical protein